MKEQSHKSEMGAALRGDFERLRARRGEGDAVQVLPRPVPEPVAVVTEPAAVPGPAVNEPAEPAGQSWFGRLRNRH